MKYMIKGFIFHDNQLIELKEGLIVENNEQAEILFSKVDYYLYTLIPIREE